MKKNYLDPKMEIVTFSAQAVLVVSADSYHKEFSETGDVAFPGSEP